MGTLDLSWTAGKHDGARSAPVPAAGRTPRCAQCDADIPGDDVNVAADVAYCRVCNVAYALSALRGDALSGFDALARPKGVWVVEAGRDVRVGASCRSLVGALGLLFFAGFWNSIVGIFVLAVTASSIQHAGGTLPAWFPAPTTSGGGSMGLGMTLFMWVFLLPFIAIGLGLMGAFMLCLAGRVEVVVRGGEGRVITGVGGMGWRQRFDPSQVVGVELEQSRWTDSDGDRQQQVQVAIALRDGKRIRFGRGLPEERRRFVAGMARTLLVGKGAKVAHARSAMATDNAH